MTVTQKPSVPVVPQFRIGQIWKNRRNNTQRWILITETYVREYQDGITAVRVKYAFSYSANFDGSYDSHVGKVDIEHGEMDSRSIAKMYPYLLFNPPYPQPHPDDGK